MPFEKGQSKVPGSGRKKGSKNKKRVPRVVEHLAENDIYPVVQILELIPTLDSAEQIETWLELLSYCEAKPKEAFESSQQEDEKEEDVRELVEQILAIARSNEKSA